MWLRPVRARGSAHDSCVVVSGGSWLRCSGFGSLQSLAASPVAAVVWWLSSAQPAVVPPPAAGAAVRGEEAGDGAESGVTEHREDGIETVALGEEGDGTLGNEGMAACVRRRTAWALLVRVMDAMTIQAADTASPVRYRSNSYQSAGM